MTPVREAWRTIRPAAGDPDGRLPPLLLVLTFVTGVVDAVSYLSLGHVFVANMTGNVVFIGFALAGAAGFSLGPSLVALAAFAAGSALGGRLAAGLAQRRERLLATAATIQVALVGAATAASATSRSQYAMIALLAVALGLQNAVVRRLGVADMTTTVLTLTTTGIFADARWLGGPGGRVGRRLSSLVAMLVGAVVGAMLLVHVSSSAALGVALVLLALVAVAARGGADRGAVAQTGGHG
jgi:uncharacterized membrane protein YoaK (UPF0700 family)